MTLTEFQELVHVLYQGDIDYPGVSDGEYTQRTQLLKYAIGLWASEEGILWNELWKLSTPITADGSASYSVTDTDIKFIGGFVRVVDGNGQSTYYEVVTPDRFELFRNAAEKVCMFTGNKRDGRTLTFNSAPTSGSIYFPYYKEPFIPTSAAHVIEMNDPEFAVQVVLAKLHEDDGDGDRATIALQLAQQKLKAMRTLNMMTPPWQDGSVPDRDYAIGVKGFGR